MQWFTNIYSWSGDEPSLAITEMRNYRINRLSLYHWITSLIVLKITKLHNILQMRKKYFYSMKGRSQFLVRKVIYFSEMLHLDHSDIYYNQGYHLNTFLSYYLHEELHQSLKTVHSKPEWFSPGTHQSAQCKYTWHSWQLCESCNGENKSILTTHWHALK